LQSGNKCGKISTNQRWLACPVCGWQRLMRLLPETRATRLPVWCRRCKRESIVDIKPESQSL
jgi:ribosomal protein L37E